MNDAQDLGTRFRLALRLNALAYSLVGLVLLGGTWDWLYDKLGLPLPYPAIYAQLAGALMLAVAHVLGSGARHDERATIGAQGAAIANTLGFVSLVFWLLGDSAERDALPTRGSALLWIVTVALLVLAALEAPSFRRDLAR